MNRRHATTLALACALCAGRLPPAAAAPIDTRPVRFPAGATGTVLRGTIRGDRSIDYQVNAQAGQTMSVRLDTDHGSNHFNVLAPGSNDAAMFIGSTLGNEWRGTLPASGVYTLRVYLMRSAARRNASARFSLSVAVTGAPASGPGPAPR